MASTHEFFVVKPKDWVIRVQKVRVENDLHAIVMSVEKLYTSNLIEDWVSAVVCHVVRCHRWERIALKSVDSAF